MTDEEKEKVTYTRPKDEGEVDKRRFAGIMGVAGTVAMIALISFFSIGMVGAALGVGIGGFVANFEQVTYNDTTATDPNAQIYPVLGAQAACDSAPQLEASLKGDAQISGGVEFFKDLPLPSSPGFDTDSFARISIIGAAPSSNPITITDLDLRLTALESPELKLSDANIREFAPSDYNNGTNSEGASYAPSGQGTVGSSAGATQSNTPEFGINASSFVLPQGGIAAAHQVSFQSISLTNLDLAVNIINNSTPAVGPTPRVVDPEQRTCGALGDESRSNAFDNATDGTGGGNVLAY
jgi:hypothetical protein